MRAISPSNLEKELRANAKADIPSMIWGPPGSGKSQIVYQLAKSMNAKLFELRANLFDPVDVRGGLKVVEQENGTYKTRYGIPEDYPDADYDGLVMLFIDELSNAPKATQNALLQLTLDKKIGTYHLPARTIIIAAGNRQQDRAAVHEMPTPVKNRFSHFELETNIDDWCPWAYRNNVDPSIISFLRYRPALLHNVDSTQNAFPSPRAWEMLNRKLKHLSDEFYGCASLVGDGAAGEYIAFKSIYKELPDIDDLIDKPSTTPVPTGPSVLYAIAGAITSRVTETNFEPVMRYTKRMPAEYQVIVIRDSIAKEPNLLNHDAFKAWTKDNASVLL
jgi:hypothetical protein